MDVGENSCDIGDTNVGGIVWWRKNICSFTILFKLSKQNIQMLGTFTNTQKGFVFINIQKILRESISQRFFRHHISPTAAQPNLNAVDLLTSL